MGHNNIIYGGIEEIEGGYVHYQRDFVRAKNEDVLISLPDVDRFDPPLINSMFNIPKMESKSVYRSRPIAFGASFNCVFFEPEEWLQRFEDVLSRLYWSNVTMFIRPDIGDVQIISWKSKMWELKKLPVEKDVEVPPSTVEWERTIFKPKGEYY